MADISNPLDEAMEKNKKGKKDDTKKTTAPVEDKSASDSDNEPKTDKGNITAVEKMVEKLLMAQQGFSKQIDGIVTSVNDIRKEQQFTNKQNEERFKMLENQKRQFLRERQRRAMENREGFDIPERPTSPARRSVADYEDEPSDDYENGPANDTNEETDVDESDFEDVDKDPSGEEEEYDESDFVEPDDDSPEAGPDDEPAEEPSDDDTQDNEEEDGEEADGEAGGEDTEDGEDTSDSNKEEEVDEEEKIREAKRRAIAERKQAREARRTPVVAVEETSDDFEDEEYIEPKQSSQGTLSSGSGKMNKQVVNSNVQETEKWLKDEESEYTLQRMQALAANIKGSVTSATKMNDELRITLEEVRKENQNLTDIALRMEKILQNFLEIQSNSVDLNDKVTRTVSYARDVFQKEYAETLAATSTSACSQFLSDSRKKYEELFDKAVKNFKQFSDAAVAWQKEIESKSNKKLDRVSKVSMASPILLVIVIVLQIYIIMTKP